MCSDCLLPKESGGGQCRIQASPRRSRLVCPARRVIKERESRHGGSGGALTVILVTLVRLNMLRVAVSDFPVYDGSVPPDEFITRCRRLAALGGIPAEQLSAIITVQCRGLAFKALEGDHGQTDVPTLLQKTFGEKQPETAAVQLSTARKDSMSVLDYCHRILPPSTAPRHSSVRMQSADAALFKGPKVTELMWSKWSGSGLAVSL